MALSLNASGMEWRCKKPFSGATCPFRRARDPFTRAGDPFAWARDPFSRARDWFSRRESSVKIARLDHAFAIFHTWKTLSPYLFSTIILSWRISSALLHKSINSPVWLFNRSYLTHDWSLLSKTTDMCFFKHLVWSIWLHRLVVTTWPNQRLRSTCNVHALECLVDPFDYIFFSWPYDPISGLTCLRAPYGSIRFDAVVLTAGSNDWLVSTCMLVP